MAKNQKKTIELEIGFTADRAYVNRNAKGQVDSITLQNILAKQAVTVKIAGKDKEKAEKSKTAKKKADSKE